MTCVAVGWLLAGCELGQQGDGTTRFSLKVRLGQACFHCAWKHESRNEVQKWPNTIYTSLYRSEKITGSAQIQGWRNRLHFFFFLNVFIDFRKSEEERERNIDLLLCPFVFLVCALAEDQTCNLGISGPRSNQLSNLARDRLHFLT